jgi:type II secretory pathway pseudopilin PulG
MPGTRPLPQPGRKPRIHPPHLRAVTAIEVLVVVSIIAVLTAALMPVVVMIREHSRMQQAAAVVRAISIAMRNYAAEDPQRRAPAAEADGEIREDPTGATMHLMNALEQAHADGGIHALVADAANAPLRVLVDPWKRPYRYALDNAGAADPSQPVSPTRPDPSRLDWNGLGQVPFAYVWSLGSPLHGSAGDMASDPDAQPANSANWIYVHSSPGQP